MFGSQIYVYRSGHGFAPLPPRETRTAARLEARTWRPDEGVSYQRKVVRLGPEVGADEWHERDAPPASILASYGSVYEHDARRYGYRVLDLHPLGGQFATLSSDSDSTETVVGERATYPRPDDAELLVGLAVADAFELGARRLCVLGPDWAVGVLAAMPGVVVHRGRDFDEGTCEAWGRRWQVARHLGRNAIEVAMRLAGPHVCEDRVEWRHGDVASVRLGTNRDEPRKCAVKSSEDDLWCVALPSIGRIDAVVARGNSWGEPRIRRPYADDAWLQRHVGDGDLIDAAGDVE